MIKRNPVACFLLVVILSNPVFAKNKLDISFGWFQVSAKTARTSGKLSNLGTYQLLFRKAFAPKFEFGLGYSLSASKTISGDMAFGPDIGLYYFPITSTNGESFTNSDLAFSTSEHYKPFVGFGFHQRQYQSTQASYAGFSGSLGTEYFISDSLSLKGELRLMNLSGPSNASATETNLLVGSSFAF